MAFPTAQYKLLLPRQLETQALHPDDQVVQRGDSVTIYCHRPEGSATPTFQSEGEAREYCDVHHLNYDDVIVIEPSSIELNDDRTFTDPVVTDDET